MASIVKYIGIDYSGARTRNSRLPGLRVAQASQGRDPVLIATPADTNGRGWNWTRFEIAEWLIAAVRSGPPFIVGIDHAFSFPNAYFQRYELTGWQRFLDDFADHWPTDEPNTYVDFIRERDPQRVGERNEFRITERWTSSAKSVFAFDIQGQVAKSTHTGIPWLRRIRQEVGDQVHFWPFDGWRVDPGKSVIAEVYPSIFRNRYPRTDRTIDQQDAYATARWLQEMDTRGQLERYFDPPLTTKEKRIADLEGWILGVA